MPRLRRQHQVLVYGVFGSGKTNLLGMIAKQLIDAGEKIRLVTAEHYAALQPLIDAGMLEVWKVNTRDYPFVVTQKACDGWWPVEPLDPTSPLVAPTPDTWSRYPVRIFEGMATFANYISGNSVRGGMAERIGRGQQIGPTDSGELIRLVDGEVDDKGVLVDKEQGTVVGGLSRSNYGFVQKEMQSLVHRTLKYPGYVFWTTHEDDVKEKKNGVSTGKTLIGPEVFGGALTNVIGREFADLWRIAQVPIDYSDGAGGLVRIVERRLYLRDHVDEFMVAKAKCNIPAEEQGEDFPTYIKMTNEKGLVRKDLGKIIVERLRL